MLNHNDKLFRKYVEGELSREEERKALHNIADDEEMRSMLQFELKLQQSFRREPDIYSFEVPEGFSKSVMQEVHGLSTAEEKEKQTESAESHPGWLDWLLKPRPVALRPAYAMVLILVLAVALAIPDFSTPEQQQQVTESTPGVGESVQTISQTNDEVWLRFVYIDKNAGSVAVAGDFSDWEPVSLSKQEVNGEQVWTGLISMSRGEHRYMFVKDGEKWVTDPLAPMHREDGFGNKNAVIYL